MKEESKHAPLQSAVSRAVGRLGECSGFNQLPTTSSLKQTRRRSRSSAGQNSDATKDA